MKLINTNNISVQTTENIMNKFIDSLDVKPSSKKTYRKALQRFFDWTEERNLQNQLVRTDILAYKNYLMDNYKACTVSSYISAVKAFYIYLEAEKISPNIASAIKGAKQSAGFYKDSLTIEQAKELLNSIDKSNLQGLRDYAIINLLINTGLRTIELERANIEDIRQSAGRSLLYIQGKGRDSKDNFVVLTATTEKPIREYLQARKITVDNAPLFASVSDRNKGGRLTTRSIRRIVKDRLKYIGINNEKLSAHSLRHTAITFSLLAGASIQEAQQMARHSNINTTMIYAHNINRLSNNAESKIEILLEN